MKGHGDVQELSNMILISRAAVSKSECLDQFRPNFEFLWLVTAAMYILLHHFSKSMVQVFFVKENIVNVSVLKVIESTRVPFVCKF